METIVKDTNNISANNYECKCCCRHAWRFLDRAVEDQDSFADSTKVKLKYDSITKLYVKTNLTGKEFFHKNVTYSDALLLMKELIKCKCCERHQNKVIIPSTSNT